MLTLGLACPGAQAIEAGQPAPGYAIPLLDGTTFTPDRGAGHVVVLHFWATWCIPCRGELPAIERYYRKHHGGGLDFIAISVDDPSDLATVKEMLGHFSYPGAVIQEAHVRGYGRIWRIPLTFVIDRNGVLRYDAWGGGPDGLDEVLLESTLTPLLAGH